MKLERLISQRRSALSEQCARSIAETYASETSKFLVREKDRFHNPVGHAIKAGVESLLSLLAEWDDPRALPGPIVEMIKVRAVQQFSPSEAVSFVVLAREAVRDDLSSSGADSEALRELDGRMERVLLLAFDVYMECRERLLQIQAKALRDRSYVLLKRMNQELEAESEKQSDGPESD